MLVRSLTAAAFFLALTTSPAQAAESTWEHEATSARTALARSLDASYITTAEAARYTSILADAARVRKHIPKGRELVLRNVLAQVARPKSPTAPRALELYTTLEENTAYLESHVLPADGADITGGDGAVYRYFANQGLEFHPLANAGALNALVASGDTEAANALVDALTARAVPRPDDSLTWEYHFNFAGQRAPWTSGMAQAVLAQAFARAGNLDLAKRAWQAIPGTLDRSVAAGTWIRLYSQSTQLVLNAQLQSAMSLADYGNIAQDPAATDYAATLLATAKSMLPQFDTGHWSRYALRVDSDLHYQDYVISLLKTLGSRTGDPFWRETADRFTSYEQEPPLLTGPTVTRTVIPRPRDGVRDDLVVHYWLSKPSKVALVVDGKAVDGYRLKSGWHTFRWSPSTLAAGTHPVRLVAADLNGNPGATDAGTFDVVRDTTPPELSAAKGNGRVYWHAADDESACCKVRVILRGKRGPQVLTRAKAHGAAAVPAGYWNATVVVHDAAGKASERTVGLVVGRSR